MKICIDSRKVSKGDAFYCIKGKSDDGHRYIESAVDKGAAIIVHQDELTVPKREGVDYIKVKDIVQALNEAASEYYGYPSENMTIFGATGTNGKSTICYVLSELFSRHADPCGYIGTIGAKLGEKTYESELTTPDTVTVQRLLSEMLADGAGAATIEVSAQGCDQDRIGSVDFDFGIWTNLTYEHLDYFGTMENYYLAKEKFFRSLRQSATAIINVDDEYAERIISACECSVVTYGIDKDADYMATDITYCKNGMELTLVHDSVRRRISTNLNVRYNIYNLLAVTAALCEYGIPIDEIIPDFKDINVVPGRQVQIDKGQNFRIIVDYSHTADSYEKLLGYYRNDFPGVNRIITVSGAAGKRDKVNRKLFGELLGRYVDIAFLTADDPRDEDPADIAGEIASFFPDNFEYLFIADRAEAIKRAISCAGENDVVLLLGKGTEKYQFEREGKTSYIGDDVAAEEALTETLSR